MECSFPLLTTTVFLSLLKVKNAFCVEIFTHLKPSVYDFEESHGKKACRKQCSSYDDVPLDLTSFYRPSVTSAEKSKKMISFYASRSN